MAKEKNVERVKDLDLFSRDFPNLTKLTTWVNSHGIERGDVEGIYQGLGGNLWWLCWWGAGEPDRLKPKPGQEKKKDAQATEEDSNG